MGHGPSAPPQVAARRAPSLSAASSGREAPVADAVVPTLRTSTADDVSEGMSYLETLPQRVIRTYIPLFIIIVVLLFPFYWMVITAIKPDEQLIDMEHFNPF